MNIIIPFYINNGLDKNEHNKEYIENVFVLCYDNKNSNNTTL